MDLQKQQQVGWGVLILFALTLTLTLTLTHYFRNRPRVRVRVRVLALDLDETLLHTRFDLSQKTAFRPYVAHFLSSLAASGRFDEISVFTAGTREYAAPLIAHLESMSGISFGRKLYRDSCTAMPGGGYVKDLRVLGHPTAQVTLVDNLPSSYGLQPECGVGIPDFTGDPGDRALLEMLARLLAE